MRSTAMVAPPSGRGSTRWTISTRPKPTRHVHDRPARLPTIRAGTGTTPSSRAAPMAPRRTSGSPSFHAPRTCGDQRDQASGRASRGHAASGGASVAAAQVRIDLPLPALRTPARRIERSRRVRACRCKDRRPSAPYSGRRAAMTPITSAPTPPFMLTGGTVLAERLATLTHDLLGALGSDHCLAWTNPAWELVLGWTAAELRETPYHELVHPA